MVMTFPAYTDHSWGRPGAQAIVDGGYLGVMRYLGDPGNGRNISKYEMDSYHDAGLLVGFIWEGAANRVLDGANAGHNDATQANYWLDQLGVPHSVPVIGTTVDFEANVDQLRGPVADYARAFTQSSQHPQYPYGSNRTLDVLCGELKLFPCGWQTRAWSYGHVSRYACMLQEVGYVLANTSDHNSILNLDDATRLGWNPNVISPKPPPKTQEDEMLTIYWSKIGCTWVKDVAGLNNTISQGFAVEGRLCTYIGERAREGHEGWDARTTAVRGNLALLGFPNGEREAGEVDNDVWEGLCLMPMRVPSEYNVGTSTAVIVADPKEYAIATVDELRRALEH